MSIFHNRPLFTFCSAFTVGAILLFPCALGIKLALAGLSLLLLLLFLILRKFSFALSHTEFPLVSLCIGVLLTSLLSALYVNLHLAKIKAYDSFVGSYTATVKEERFVSDYSSLYTVTVTSIGKSNLYFDALFSYPGDFIADCGDTLRGCAAFSLPAEYEDGFPLRDYYASQGILLVMNVDPATETVRTANKDSLFTWFHRLSDTLAARLHLMLGKEDGGFAAGLLLGRREQIPDAIRRDFRYLGISHILAVSGLHLSVLAGGFLMLLRLFRIRRSVRFVLASLLIFGFMCITDFTPSVVRAGLMLLLFLLSILVARQNDLPTSLSFAAFLIVLLSPGAVTDPGYLLSISATAGIIFIGSPVSSFLRQRTIKRDDWLTRLSEIAALLVLTLSALFFTLPLCYYYFGELSLVTPLFNLLFIPLVTLLLPFLFLILVFYGTPAGPLLAAVASDLTSLFTSAVSFSASLVPAPISLSYDFTLPALLVAAGVLLVGFLVVKRKPWVPYLASALSFCLLFGIPYAIEQTSLATRESVLVASYGKNEFLLLQSEGKTLLCDFSGGGYSSIQSVAELTHSEFSDTSLDALLLTRLYNLHLSSLPRLADNHRLEYLFLPTPTNADEEDLCRRIVEKMEERAVTVRYYDVSTDTTLVFGSCRLSLPRRTYIDRSSQPLSALFIDGQSDLLYLGGGVTESALYDDAKRYAAEAEVLILGQHGPKIKEPLPDDLPLPPYLAVTSDEVNLAYGTALAVVPNGRHAFRYYRLSSDSQ